MKDYQKRLVEEYKQLKERLVQLDNFVKEQEGFGVEESKVVVQEFVAEWIEEARVEGYSLYGALEMVEEANEDWLFGNGETNQDTFARAWLAYPNITVEKEKLYTVEIAEAILTKITRGSNIQYKMLPSEDVSAFFYKAIYTTKLTEQEIKQKDERLWQWAKEVEE